MGKDLNGKELGVGLYQRKDGRYEAKATVDGVKINLYDNNLAKLKASFKEAKENISLTIAQKYSRITLDEWFEQWFDTYRAPYIKPASIFPMKSKYNNTFGRLLGKMQIQKIMNVHVQDAVTALAKEGRATSSIREALGTVTRCMESARNNRIIEINPCFDIQVPWEKKNVNRRFLTVDEQNSFMEAAENNWYKEMFYVMLHTGLRVGDDDDKIRLNQRKPSKYKGLSRFGPEKNLQRINKFMKERPIFYKNLIQMKENFRFYLRCFYCITKVVILQFNSENRTELARNG